MTAPDPAQLTAPVDPAAYRHKVLGPTYWAAIAFAFLCVIAGFAIAKLGPTLFPAHPAAPLPAVQLAAPAQPNEPSAAAQAAVDAEQAAVSPPAPAPSVEVAALSARVDRLEADRRATVRAAAGALAAASLSDAAASSRPFQGELAALEASLPESPDLRALRPLAQSGAPTLAALAAEYPDQAAHAAVASRARARGEGLMARIAQAFAAILTIRRVDKLDGDGVDAILARAGRKVDDGDLSGALAELNALPPSGKDAVAAWRARAEKRVEIDRRVDAVRAAALAELTRAAADEGSPR